MLLPLIGSSTKPTVPLCVVSGFRFGLLRTMLATPPAHSLLCTESARASSKALFGSLAGKALAWVVRSLAKALACGQRFGSSVLGLKANLVDGALSVRLGARKPDSSVPRNSRNGVASQRADNFGEAWVWKPGNLSTRAAPTTSRVGKSGKLTSVNAASVVRLALADDAP